MKKNSRGFIPILIIVLVITLITGAYFLGIKKGSPVYNVIPAVLPTTNSNQVETWKTYTSQNGSVINSYPGSWVLMYYKGTPGYKGMFMGSTATVEHWTIENKLFESGEDLVQVKVTLEKNQTNANLNTFLDCSASGGCSNVIINGQEYLTNSLEQEGKQISKNFITIHNGELLYISFGGQNMVERDYETVNRIVSSFKFTN